jgi:hypothetical protein
VQTRDLFSALLRVAPKSLAPITRHIPAQALPLPTPGSVATEPYVAEERPWLSHCVNSAIRRLGAALPADRKLTAADIFAEIALNGSGESVRLLREHQVTPEVIERILATEHLDLVATRGQRNGSPRCGD